MTSQQILESFIDFYLTKNHKLVPNVSLVPEGDSTLLFVNSGMFPLVPYLSGQEHPLGKRLVNVQRAIRFEDMDEVGDNRHATAFHMIGNWSLGDYFKDDQLAWAYEWLIEHLHLDPAKMYATVFAGDENAPKDEESVEILKTLFSKYKVTAHVFAYDKKSNWWQRGDAVGELGGPDSEIYYYMKDGSAPVGQGPADDESSFFEICNSVFMQYKKSENGWEVLPQANVDFGGGLERIAVAVQGKHDIFETDNFWPIIQKIQEISGRDYYSDEKTTKNMRILADHMRASVFLAMDGVTPSNKDQGYILRRLLRRMVRAGRELGFDKDISVILVATVTEMFAWLYPELSSKTQYFQELFALEEEKFRRVLVKGVAAAERALVEYGSVGKEPKKLLTPPEAAKIAFELYQSQGLPEEIFVLEVIDKGITLDKPEFYASYKQLVEDHQNKSRSGAEKIFKGGLADTGEISTRYHTATHLLQRALKTVLGEHVHQLGSNITAERLRFDFPNMAKLTPAEILQVENIINDAVDKALPVNFVMLPKDKALETGALHLKNETYPDTVKVYFIGDTLETAFSKEFCGGPHVSNTKDVGHIKLFKQESIGDGKQRVYARFAMQP